MNEKEALVSKIHNNVFMRGYIDAMFFVEKDENEESFDQNENLSLYSFDEDDLSKIISECEEFWAEAEPIVVKIMENHFDTKGDCKLDAHQAGIDFYMTRQGAGVGFWDGDYDTTVENGDGKELAKKLTDLTDRFGNLYVESVGDKLYYTSEYKPQITPKP